MPCCELMRRTLLAALTCALLACSAPPPAWRVVTTEPSGWLLAVTATADRVLAAGGQPGAGPGRPGQGVITVVRGQAPAGVQRQPSPQPGMLWWVHALPGGVAWLAGENGSVVRYDESRPDAQTGLPRHAVTEGETVAGVYRNRLTLASGRFAMIDDGLGFQLVPWSPSLEKEIGKQVSGVMSPGGGVDWSFGRRRGIGR